jgi:ribosomal protein L11 methyltransferase
VSGLFPGEQDTETLLAELERRLAPERLPAPGVEVLEDRQWARLHREGFEPTCFGGRLWVVPSWSQAPSLIAGQASMTMDPGIAFGTGSHPTTAMCLAWLAGERIEDREVIDYGCGSGILAVAAAKLGARRVWAVDNDPPGGVQHTRQHAEHPGGDPVHVAASGWAPGARGHIEASVAGCERTLRALVRARYRGRTG